MGRWFVGRVYHVQFDLRCALCSWATFRFDWRVCKTNRFIWFLNYFILLLQITERLHYYAWRFVNISLNDKLYMDALIKPWNVDNLEDALDFWCWAISGELYAVVWQTRANSTTPCLREFINNPGWPVAAAVRHTADGAGARYQRPCHSCDEHLVKLRGKMPVLSANAQGLWFGLMCLLIWILTYWKCCVQWICVLCIICFWISRIICFRHSRGI